MKTAAFSYLGDDDWAPIIRKRYAEEGMDTSALLTHPTSATSTTVVMIDPSGERSFYHCVGAPDELSKSVYLDHLDLFAQSRMALIGYYGLMPKLEADMPAVLEAIRKTGCQTAMDAAGDGGTMQPLDRMLPHLDVYFPSRTEAYNQTGETDPRKIIAAYRDCGAPGLLGVKLGTEGALISGSPGQFVEVDQVEAPGAVIDTTGAGDCFYAGLLTGLLKGLDLADTGRLAAAAGASCVTAMGGCGGVRDYPTTAKLAGIG